MRLTNRLMLLAVMTATALLLVTPSAFAQGSETEPLAMPGSTDLSASSETTGAPCSAVSPATPPASGTYSTSGGCLAHGAGLNIRVHGHLFGIESTDSTCNWELAIRLGLPLGLMIHQELTSGTVGTCTRKPCDQASFTNPQSEGRPWRAFAFESQTGAPEERLTLLFCLEDRDADGGNRRHCNATIPFTETANHRYAFTANDLNASGTPRCELEGTLSFESNAGDGGEGPYTQVEINHL